MRCTVDSGVEKQKEEQVSLGRRLQVEAILQHLTWVWRLSLLTSEIATMTLLAAKLLATLRSWKVFANKIPFQSPTCLL